MPIAMTGDGLDVGTSRPLFGGKVLPIDRIAFTHDGKRALGAARPPSTTGPILTIVTQWASELSGK